MRLHHPIPAVNARHFPLRSERVQKHQIHKEGAYATTVLNTSLSVM